MCIICDVCVYLIVPVGSEEEEYDIGWDEGTAVQVSERKVGERERERERERE